jgi:hypothetical protein
MDSEGVHVREQVARHDNVRDEVNDVKEVEGVAQSEAERVVEGNVLVQVTEENELDRVPLNVADIGVLCDGVGVGVGVGVIVTDGVGVSVGDELVVGVTVTVCVKVYVGDGLEVDEGVPV